MNAMYMILFLVAIVAGVGIYLFMFSPTSFTTITTKITSLLTPIYNSWTALPDLVRGLILAAVPTLFLAWTKSRAMNKIKEVETQASSQSNQIIQLEGEKIELREQLASSSTAGMENLVKSRDDALTQSKEDQQLVSNLQQQIREMQMRHNAEIGTLNNTIAQLKLKERVIVK